MLPAATGGDRPATGSTRRPAAAAPARAQAARGSHRVAGDLPTILGRQLRTARRRARGAEGAEEAWTQQEIEETCYESREARDAVLKSPMESGVAQSYDKLVIRGACSAASAPCRGARNK